MFGQIANIATSMVSGIHQPSLSFIPFLGWLEFLIPLIPYLFQGLFGGGEDETEQQKTTGTQTGTTTTTAPPSGYQSPTLGLQDLLMQAALGKNLKMFGGAGMPGGQTIAPDFLNDFLSLIGSSYTDLQKKYTNPAPINPIPILPVAPSPAKITACEIKCKKNLASFSQSHAAVYKACYDACIKEA
jgi:hypothetical protein